MRGTSNPNLQVVITHASHVSSLHSFGLPLRMKHHYERLALLSLMHALTRVLTICHVKLAQSTALEQKRFDLRLLSPTFRNFWVLLEGRFYCSRSFALDSAHMKFNLKITRDIETRNLYYSPLVFDNI